MHDIEKPWKYEIGPDGKLQHKPWLQSQEAQHEFRDKKIKEYGIQLTPEHENALKYVHGEGDDYSAKERMAGPLAAFCHICDVRSARIWFDHPAKEGDSWWPARRVNVRR